MKTVIYTEYGKSEDVLKVQDVPKPQITQPDQVLVKVRAASLNPVDYKLAFGYLKQMIPKLPYVAAVDLAGEVVEVGAGVKKFQVGDHVYGKLHLTDGGALAEYALLSESHALVKKPANISFEEASTIALVGLTSLQSLKKVGATAGKKVLILGGSGGTGALGIQIAKKLGAHVTATTSTKNLDFVRSLGAEVVDYTAGDWSETLKGQNFDIVYDTVGGGYAQSAAVLKEGGQFVTISGGSKPPFENGPAYTFVFVTDDLADFEQLAAWVAEGSVKAVVDKVYPFSETHAAFKHLESGRARGKVVVSL